MSIPETKENLNQHWETWITFKEGKSNESGGFINQEFAVRVYINTPEYYKNKADTKNSFQQDFNILYFVFLLVIIIILIITIIVFYKKKF